MKFDLVPPTNNKSGDKNIPFTDHAFKKPFDSLRTDAYELKNFFVTSFKDKGIIASLDGDVHVFDKYDKEIEPDLEQYGFASNDFYQNDVNTLQNMERFEKKLYSLSHKIEKNDFPSYKKILDYVLENMHFIEKRDIVLMLRLIEKFKEQITGASGKLFLKKNTDISGYKLIPIEQIQDILLERIEELKSYLHDILK